MSEIDLDAVRAHQCGHQALINVTTFTDRAYRWHCNGCGGAFGGSHVPALLARIAELEAERDDQRERGDQYNREAQHWAGKVVDLEAERNELFDGRSPGANATSRSETSTP